MFASAAALLGVASVWMLERSLEKVEYHDLQERADDIQEVLSHQGQVQSTEQLRDVLEKIYAFRDDGKYLQVRDEHGNWIYRSRRMISQNAELGTPDTLPKAGLVVDFHQGTHFVRTLEYPIAAEGIRYSVQTGTALDRNLGLLKHFLFKMMLLTPAVILLATAGGHFMSRTALKPVAALTAEAHRINDRNLHIPLPMSDAKDEISDLSKALNRMLERIDEAFTSVRTFTGNASHELRTPIALLRTEIEVALYRDREVEEYRAILTRLHEQTISMTSLVENLLSLARADGGAETIALAPVRVATLFLQLENNWAQAMNQAMLDFRVEMPNDDVFVLGDLRSIQRLLSILLENASRYTPHGGTVNLGAIVKGERVILSVRDTGVGIAPEHTPRVFDRFYRATPASETAPAGSGLGLALGKWIAERHATELKVDSEPGRGTNFSFALRRTIPDIPVNQVLRASQSRAEREPTLLLPRRGEQLGTDRARRVS